MSENNHRRLPGYYRGKFFCVDSAPKRQKSLLEKVLESIPYQKPLSHSSEQLLMFEVGRAINILQQLDRPNPNLSFLKTEKSIYRNPLLIFRKIIDEGKRIQEEKNEIEKLRRRLEEYGKSQRKKVKRKLRTHFLL